MTCTLLSIASRREGMSHDECIEYLDQEHTPLVENPFDRDGTRYDVLAKLQFESLEALNAAFDSEEGQRVLEDTDNFLDGEETVLLVLVDETLRYRSIPTEL